jgi:hypothetical protein
MNLWKKSKIILIAPLLELSALKEVEWGVEAHFQVTFEIEAQPKPAGVAEVIYRYYI